MIIAKPRGTADLLPEDSGRWRYIEEKFRQICREYNFGEIRTPVFEYTDLFERGVGDTTDIVEKEMYTFRDRGDRSITLRPEGTAPIVRAYLENNLHAGPQPVKLYYMGPMFRYDKPQAGRFRQFHQVGAEILGSPDPAADAEMIAMAMDFYGSLGLKNLDLHINSVGCPKCRVVLKQKLQEYFQPRLSDLCANCRDRLYRNPLRILDCKSKICSDLAKKAPTTMDHLCDECTLHLNKVKNYLGVLQVPYKLDAFLVRGLDYYTHTAFEIIVPDIGAQSSIGGGGRYNGLVEACGGPPVPGVGYAIGVERTILAMELQGTVFPERDRPDVYVISASPACEEAALKILYDLRRSGLAADKDYLGRSIKAQMKLAGKSGCRFAAIIGNDELLHRSVSVKDMATGNQIEIPQAELAEKVGNTGGF